MKQERELIGNTAHSVTRVRKNRKPLTLQDAREVAALCALRCSEREATAALGIAISSWAHWKSRNRNREDYEEIMNQLRAAKIQGHLENVEAHSVKDWRASIAYLEKTIPDRFSTAAERASVDITLNGLNDVPDYQRNAIMEKAIKLALQGRKAARVIDVTEVKQITGPPNASTAQAETKESQ